MSAILCTVSDLSASLESSSPPVLLDVRWALGDPDGHGKYVDAHIPGAVFVDLNAELAGHGVPTDGRHPLPDIADLQASARRWGIDSGSTVVVYDATGNLAAARAWWLLRWAGFDEISMLDGGLQAWHAADLPVHSGEETASRPGDVSLSAGNLPALTADQVADYSGTLLDARAAERYRGDVEPIDPRAGHIPGAVSAPTAENLVDGGRFAAPEVLRKRFSTFGIEPGSDVVVYCGSGVTAAHQIAALAIAGIDASLFPGSWSAWSSDPQRPVETGSGAG